MLREVNCDLCGENNTRVICEAAIKTQADDNKSEYACTNDGHGEHYRVVRCENCGLHYCSPRPESEGIEYGYKEIQDPMYQAELHGRRKTFQRNLKILSRYKQDGSLLDIGCSLGVFVDQARKAGWKIDGVEPSHWCVEQAQKIFGLKIKQGTYKDVSTMGQSFDVVTMWDVLEHVDSPLNALRIAHSVLKEDGILAFSTVDIGSWYTRFLGRKWPWLMKMHIYYFDRKCIRQYLEKTGFRVLRIGVYKHIVRFEYLLYKLRRINKILFVLMSCIYQICRLFKKEIFLTIAFGDFMEVYAQKIPHQKGSGEQG